MQAKNPVGRKASIVLQLKRFVVPTPGSPHPGIDAPQNLRKMKSAAQMPLTQEFYQSLSIAESMLAVTSGVSLMALIVIPHVIRNPVVH